MGLVGGVLALNAVLLAVGYALLAGALRGRPLLTWASWAGVALLVGAGLTGTVVFVLAILGVPARLWTFAVVAIALALAGVALARFVPARPLERGARAQSPLETAVATVACCGLVFLGVLAVGGAFRSSPWLDDVWAIWVPKGVVLGQHALDGRMFVPNPRYDHFDTLDNPLWWSTLLNLDLRFVGRIDLRAVDGQLVLLTVAFFAAATRLLWGIVRPWVLWSGLLLLAASPELVRHTQGGLADLPLGIYLALYVLCGVLWLVRGDRLALVLAFVFAATAVEIKSEGLPELLVLAAAVALLAVRTVGRRVVPLLGATVLAVATLVPWLAWRAHHHIHSQTSFVDAFTPSYLSGRSDRIGPALGAVGNHLVDPREWLLVVVALVALGIAGAVLDRRPLWLAPSALVGVGYAFWVWIYWADPERIHYLLDTSSYRVVDGVLLTAGLLLLLEAEALARRRRA